MDKKRSAEPAGDAGDEDAMAFRAAVRGVKPLAQTPKPAGLERPRTRAPRRAPARAPAGGELHETMPLVAAAPAPDSIGAADALAFKRPGVRTEVLRRLRRGLYPVEDELDLHGLSQSAARDHLAEFLAFNGGAGRRCVRIIHGKGYRSGARGPILKIAVDAWLRRHTGVLAFCSARAIDGGTGAVYVLLRA